MLKLHYHPLSSYCQKALIGLYELGVPFDTQVVNLGDAVERAAFLAIAPLGKFPVLVEDGRAIPESSILLEHLDTERRLFPSLDARAGDRFWDLHVHEHMQRIVGDKLRPEDLRQAAIIMASILLSAANSDEPLPRMPLPTRPTPTDPFEP